jgi:hypothetical protein
MNAECIYGDIAEGNLYVIIEENSIRRYTLWDCYFTKQTLLDEAAPFGLISHGFYSDATGMPYANDSQSLCAILKKSM